MPTKQAIYTAVFISLTVHAAVLAVLYFRDHPFAHVEEQGLVEVALIPVSVDFQEMLDAQDFRAIPEQMRNLVQDQAQAADPNYTPPPSQGSDVVQDLLDFEAQVFEDLAQGHEAQPDVDVSDLHREEAGRFDDILLANPEGNVTASFELADRSVMYAPIPSYRCQLSGKVHVAIEVDNQGAVLSAVVDQSRSTTANGCLLEEAAAFAERWVFASKLQAPRRQKGSITFTFVQQ